MEGEGRRRVWPMGEREGGKEGSGCKSGLRVKWRKKGQRLCLLFSVPLVPLPAQSEVLDGAQAIS